MSKSQFSVRSSNWDTFQALLDLKDQTGRPALKTTHIRIAEYIGSFLADKGCWETPTAINQKTIRTSMKTFRRHINYLLNIGVLNKKDDGRRTIYTIGIPKGPVVSQCSFRVTRGLADYSYVRKPMTTPSSFFTNPAVDSSLDMDFLEGKNLPEPREESSRAEGRIFPSEGKNLPLFPSTTIEPTIEPTLEKDYKETPPGPPQVVLMKSSSLPSADASGGPPFGRPNEEGLRLPETATSNFPKNNEHPSDMSEKFFPSKHQKRHLTGRERRAEAVKKIDAGHIANPLGAPNNRKRQHNAKQARAIGETGAVTNAQLWGHLVRLWDGAFGEGILEQMMSKDKSAIATMFSELQKQFSDTTGFYPENRDLAEYFQWFLEPKRLNGILSYAKYDKSIHVRQLAGAVYIKRFYDEVVARRKDHVSVTQVKSAVDEMAAGAEKAFQDLRENNNDHYKFVLKMVEHGYALTVQYLHEEQELAEEECRERIISLMVEFLQRVTKKDKAMAFLRSGLQTTQQNEKLLLPDSCLWYNWKKKTTGLVETAIERAKLV